MQQVMIERRVTNLEELMAQLLATVDRVDRQQERNEQLAAETQRSVQSLSREMAEFKDEMSDFKTESENFRIDMRRQWGELANKMGTMVEDLVAPSIGRILQDVVGCSEDQIESVAIRVRKRHPVTGDRWEFDAIAVCQEYLFINETKSNLRVQDIKDFVEKLPQSRDFFPEYKTKKIIGAIASLYVDDSLVRHGERQGLIVLGFGSDVMEVLNSPGFSPKTF